MSWGVEAVKPISKIPPPMLAKSQELETLVSLCELLLVLPSSSLIREITRKGNYVRIGVSDLSCATSGLGNSYLRTE